MKKCSHKWETLPFSYFKGDRLAQWSRQCRLCKRIEKVWAHKTEIFATKVLHEGG